MKITKERGILFALMTVGLVALISDRLGASPSQATGSPAAAENASQIQAIPRAQPTTMPIAPQSIAQQLRSAGGALTTVGRNAFLLSSSWGGAATPQAAAPAESPVTRFLQTHRVQGILVSDSGGTAIINGAAFAPGQVVDGFRLVSINRGFVVLEYGADRVALKLAPPGPVTAGLPNQ
jgi:hypothetical protein